MTGERLKEGREAGQGRVEQGPQNSRKLLYIPGITNSHIRGLSFERAFTKEYGEGNVMVTNSMVSTDAKNPKRWKEMADYIMASAPDGIDIAVHSLGAVELYRAIKIIEKRDADFFARTDKDKISITLIDPSGFNKKGQRLDYAKRTVRLVREHANLPGVSKKNTLERGLDSLAAFPPFLTPAEQLTQAMNAVAPDIYRQDAQQGFARIPFDAVAPNPHWQYIDRFLPEEQQVQLSVFDYALQQAIEGEMWPKAREIIIQRGELLKGALDQVYMGTLDTDQRESGRIRLGGPINAARMFALAVGRRPMDKFKQLFDMGYDVPFISPEHTIAVPIDRVVQMYDSREQAQTHGAVAEGFTHPSITSQPDNFASAVHSRRR